MRHASRERADSLDFLLLQDDVAFALLLVNFRTGTEPVDDFAIGAAQRDGSHQVPAVGTVGGAPQAMLYFENRSGTGGFVPGIGSARPILRVDHGVPIEAGGLGVSRPV